MASGTKSQPQGLDVVANSMLCCFVCHPLSVAVSECRRDCQLSLRLRDWMMMTTATATTDGGLSAATATTAAAYGERTTGSMLAAAGAGAACWQQQQVVRVVRGQQLLGQPPGQSVLQ